MGLLPIRIRWNAVVSEDTRATSRTALRRLASGELSSASGSRPPRSATLIWRTLIGCIVFGRSLSTFTASAGSGPVSVSSLRKPVSSSVRGSSPCQRSQTTSSNEAWRARSSIAYPW